MTRISRIVAAAGLVLFLAGCSTTAQQVIPAAAATISANVLSPSQLSLIQSGCNLSQGLLAKLTVPTAPASVRDTAIYPATYCSDLAAAPPGQVPATTDSGTSQWLTLAIGAAKAAAVLVPLLL
jgi:hypothetical protein